MIRIRIFVALFLAAFWLLATQHCGLEAVGLLVQGCEKADGQHGCNGTEHAADGCQIVESPTYKASNAQVKVPAPLLVACFCLDCFTAAERTRTVVPETPSWRYAERPRDWVPSRNFVQRVALAPRAPSLA